MSSSVPKGIEWLYKTIGVLAASEASRCEFLLFLELIYRLPPVIQRRFIGLDEFVASIGDKSDWDCPEILELKKNTHPMLKKSGYLDRDRHFERVDLMLVEWLVFLVMEEETIQPTRVWLHTVLFGVVEKNPTLATDIPPATLQVLWQVHKYVNKDQGPTDIVEVQLQNNLDNLFEQDTESDAKQAQEKEDKFLATIKFNGEDEEDLQKEWDERVKFEDEQKKNYILNRLNSPFIKKVFCDLEKENPPPDKNATLEQRAKYYDVSLPLLKKVENHSQSKRIKRSLEPNRNYTKIAEWVSRLLNFLRIVCIVVEVIPEDTWRSLGQLYKWNYPQMILSAVMFALDKGVDVYIKNTGGSTRWSPNKIALVKFVAKAATIMGGVGLGLGSTGALQATLVSMVTMQSLHQVLFYFTSQGPGSNVVYEALNFYLGPIRGVLAVVKTIRTDELGGDVYSNIVKVLKVLCSTQKHQMENWPTTAIEKAIPIAS